MGRMEDRVAVVTGAGKPGSLGYAIASALHAEGASVALLDLDAAGAEAAAARLGDRALGLACDVRDEDAAARALAAMDDRWGRVDVLVNNAGITQPRRTAEITRADWDAMLDVNLHGTLIMTQAALPRMGSGGAIVNIASIAAQRGGGLMGGPHYAAAKAGVLGLTRAMARDLAPQGIRVNAINPGVIMSAMTRDFYDRANTERVLPMVLLGRFGEPEDVARAALFLASDDAGYITGTALDVNGGMHFN